MLAAIKAVWAAKAVTTDQLIRVRTTDVTELRGTFPVDAPTATDSRQVRRYKVRTGAFNELSRYNLPRSHRRLLAREARLSQ